MTSDAASPAAERQPVLFLSHGAAIFTTSPSDPTHRWLAGLRERVQRLRPRAIVVVSAHYLEAPVRITGSPAPPTIHDHPVRAVYEYRYPGRGDAVLAAEIQGLLEAQGIPARVEPERGLDHGAWVPLSLMQPEGEVPVLQVSLDASLSPRRHLALGAALAPLRDRGVLLVGSGGVTHNQDEFRRAYFAGADPHQPAPFSRDFDAWVTDVLTRSPGGARLDALADFSTHPLARAAHPTIEHFLPLLVALGAAPDDPAQKPFEGFQHSLSTSAFLFG